MLRGFPLAIAVPGTVTADATWFFKAPCDLTLRAIAAGANNATSAVINVGTATDPDGFLAAAAMGQSDDPTLFDLDDFDGDPRHGPGQRIPPHQRRDGHRRQPRRRRRHRPRRPDHHALAPGGVGRR